MTFPAPLHRYPYSEYVSLEEHSPVRHEFIAGEVHAMAGGTPEHAALAAAILRLIGNQLPAGYRAYTSDLRVRVAAADVTTYPDGAVVCGKVARAADDPLAATNPVLLIEVTSPSTEGYDRGPKLETYRRIVGLAAVVIVSHREPRVAVHHRDADGTWRVTERGPGEVMELPAVGARIPVDDLYRDHELDGAT